MWPMNRQRAVGALLLQRCFASISLNNTQEMRYMRASNDDLGLRMHGSQSRPPIYYAIIALDPSDGANKR